MFKGCRRKEVGYGKLFIGRGSLNVHYNNQVGVEQIRSSKVQTSKYFLFSFFRVLTCSSFFNFLFPSSTMPPLMILKNLKFKPIFLLIQMLRLLM